MSSNQIRFSIGYDQGPRLMPVSEFAHLAEDLGYDGITLASGSTSFDPIIILAQLASASERLLLSITVQVFTPNSSSSLGQADSDNRPGFQWESYHWCRDRRGQTHSIQEHGYPCDRART